jgi:hypothetical protein
MQRLTIEIAGDVSMAKACKMVYARTFAFNLFSVLRTGNLAHGQRLTQKATK